MPNARAPHYLNRPVPPATRPQTVLASRRRCTIDDPRANQAAAFAETVLCEKLRVNKTAISHYHTGYLRHLFTGRTGRYSSELSGGNDNATRLMIRTLFVQVCEKWRLTERTGQRQYWYYAIKYFLDKGEVPQLTTWR